MSDFKKTTLRNGLRIITVPMKGTKAVTILVLVGAGSKYETKKNNGISHFIEHLSFKGTRKRPNTLEISSALDRVGGKYNAFTSQEYTGYWAKVDSRFLNLALDWVSDILLNSKFEKAAIEKERGVIIEEINMYQDTPSRYVFSLWDKLLYGDQPAGWPILGKKEVISRFKRKDFLNYLKNHYSSQDTVVCLAGNIKPQVALRETKKYFKKIRDNKIKDKPQTVEKQFAPQVLVHHKKTDQTHFCLGVRGYNLFQPQRYVQEIIATILGGNMSSRLFISLRDKNGLAYYVHTFSESATDTGYLLTHAGVDNQNIKKALELILGAYKSLKTRKISRKELQKAKDYLKGRMSLSLESSEEQASFYADQELLRKKILTPEQEIKEINKVSLDDVQQVAQDIFQPAKLNLSLIGPFREKETFLNILKKGL